MTLKGIVLLTMAIGSCLGVVICAVSVIREKLYWRRWNRERGR